MSNPVSLTIDRGTVTCMPLIACVTIRNKRAYDWLHTNAQPPSTGEPNRPLKAKPKCPPFVANHAKPFDSLLYNTS